MLARTPWTPKPEPKPKQKRLKKDRRRHLVETVARIMREGREQGAPSHFTFEASTRHGIRSGLCLEGWGWQDADAMAAEIVATALNMIGARRPTWMQGQPWWTEEGVTAIERTRCIRCHGPLPEEHRKFCSHLCKSAHHHDKARWDDRAAYNAAMRAYRSAKRNRKNADTATAA